MSGLEGCVLARSARTSAPILCSVHSRGERSSDPPAARMLGEGLISRTVGRRWGYRLGRSAVGAQGVHSGAGRLDGLAAAEDCSST